jgi:ribosomal protein S18 acetylase RimI-like enzyme
MAGDKLPSFLWRQAAKAGQSAAAVGESLVRRMTGSYSHQHVTVATVNGRVASMLLGFVKEASAPSEQEIEGPTLLRTLLALDRNVGRSWRISNLATFPKYRGRGLASQLLDVAEAKARDAGVDTVSLIVATDNLDALDLYDRHDYKKIDQRPIPYVPGFSLGNREWALLVRSLT